MGMWVFQYEMCAPTDPRTARARHRARVTTIRRRFDDDDDDVTT